MKPYMKKYYLEYNSSDIKPKGQISKAIEGSFRLQAKKEIAAEINEEILYQDAWYDYDDYEDYDVAIFYKSLDTIAGLYTRYDSYIFLDARETLSKYKKHHNDTILVRVIR